MQLEDADRGVHRGADRFEHRPQVLLLVAAQMLLRLPDLGDQHRPVDLGGAMHDEPERVLAIEIDPGCSGVVELAPCLPPADPKNRHASTPPSFLGISMRLYIRTHLVAIARPKVAARPRRVRPDRARRCPTRRRGWPSEADARGVTQGCAPTPTGRDR